MDERVRWEDMSDEELARLCSTQIAGCMEELIGRYEARIEQCARQMALDRQQAEDAVQEILLRLVTSLPRFEGRSAFGTWLYRLAHNTCIDLFRKGARESRARLSSTLAEDGPEDILAQIPSTWGDPERDLDDAIQQCYLGRALVELPDDYRLILRLRLAEGRSNQEVAETLGTTVDSVKAKLRRARQQLREHLLTHQTCPICRGLGALRITEAGEVD